MRQGHVPSFIGAFAEAEIVGACGRLEDPNAPVWDRTYVTNVEAFGAGTIAYDPETGASCRTSRFRRPEGTVSRRSH